MESWQLEELKNGNTCSLTWLGEGLFRIENNAVHMDLLVGTHQALLWDTGYGYDDLYTLVRRITDLPLFVVNSHGHVDHVCGNCQFDSVFIHEADMELCRFHNSPLYRTPRSYSVLPKGFSAEEHIPQDCGCLRPVREGDVFDLGGKTLEVIHLPGHTAGSIGLWCPERRLLWVGDAMNCFVWLFLPEAQSLSTYVGSLQKAARLPFTHMVQSHEPDPVPKRRLWDYLDLAEHLDFEQGTLVPAPLGFQGETRICTRGGVHYDDRDHPGFAAIMVSKEKICC